MTWVPCSTPLGKTSVSRLRDLTSVLRCSTSCVVGCGIAGKIGSSTPSWNRSLIVEGFPGTGRSTSIDTRHMPVSANPAAFLVSHSYKIPRCVCKHTPRVRSSGLARRIAVPAHTHCSSRRFLHEDRFWPFWLSVVGRCCIECRTDETEANGHAARRFVYASKGT